MNALRVALAMSDGVAERIFTPAMLSTLGSGLQLLSETPLSSFDGGAAAGVLSETDILITGWGCPPLTAEVLAKAPRLRFALHAAGSVKEHITEAVWRRGIQVSTAAAANAIPVAEYTLAMILLANKKVLQSAEAVQRTRGHRVSPQQLFPGLGNYGQTIGIVGASRVGRALMDLLKPFAFQVLVADPYLNATGAAQLGVELVELDQLLAASDVVTLHAPDLPATRHMINADKLALIRPGATFINTARGALVDQEALVDRIRRGDLFAVLDVTTPEVLDADNPLYGHENVIITPHIAGSLGMELARLGATAIAEAQRAARGEPLLHPVTEEEVARTA